MSDSVVSDTQTRTEVDFCITHECQKAKSHMAAYKT